MTFRDHDDDTSTGKTTQGGSKARRGNSVFWVMAAAVIIVAVVLAFATLPRKHSTAEEGTAPVSTSETAPGPSRPAATAASTAH